MKYAAAALVFGSLVVAACSDEPATPADDADDDAGVGLDASQVADSEGPLPDAGNTPIVDAGTDAGRCPAGPALKDGEHKFTFEGDARRFLTYLPKGYDPNRAWPVVLALHPNGSSAAYWNATTGPQNIRGAVADKAVLVIAEGIGGNWRDYSQDAGTYPASMEKDLRYFDKVLETVKGSVCVNEKQIFAMGFSGGASFAGVLGCQRNYIRAIASGGMVIYFDQAKCTNKPAAWLTMGALELAERGTAFRDFFRTRAACTTTSAAVAPSPCVAYQGCTAGTPVHYCQHAGGHVWPAFGTAAAWTFFSQFID